MPLITYPLDPAVLGSYIPDTDQLYNALDCCATAEIFLEVSRIYGTDSPVYSFERALQGPVLEIANRGWLIDEEERRRGIKDLTTERARYEKILQRLAFAVWDKPLNPNSPKQLVEFFYDWMNIPKIWTSEKGERKLKMDRDTLEKLEVYMLARPIIACILAIRDLSKQIQVFETAIDSDQRMRFSLNIGGTTTGRFSSSASSSGTGRNIQNIDEVLRRMFIADADWKLCGIDLEQAESREVGWLLGILFNDWTYLNACYSGDLHTIVCKLVWPELPWTGDAKADKAIAEREYYRGFSYRDMSKRAGHASNYGGSAWTISRALKLPMAVIEAFQERYYSAFPAILEWHKWVRKQLAETHMLTTPFGRTRHFFGRSDDDSTVREAIAYSPQSSTADRMNLGLWRTWHKFGPKSPTPVRLLAQVHDAIYFLYRPKDEPIIIPAVLEQISVPMTHPSGNTLIVPGEAKIGWNWGNAWTQEMENAAAKRSADANIPHIPKRLNTLGLQKFKPGQPDTRRRAEGLDYVF